jgi:hypothetical protein
MPERLFCRCRDAESFHQSGPCCVRDCKCQGFIAETAYERKKRLSHLAQLKAKSATLRAIAVSRGLIEDDE